MTHRKPKKSESLDIRLPFEQKRDFMAATKQRGETASEALRDFIATYIDEARPADHPTKVQEISMTLARHRFKTLATAAGAAIGVFSLAALPSAADPSAFETMDKNKDGVITEGEIAPGFDAAIIEKLDTDGSGGVSEEELFAAGNQIVIRTEYTNAGDDSEGTAEAVISGLNWTNIDDGTIQGIVTTNIEDSFAIKRVKASDELSKEEILALVEQALDGADLSDGSKTNIRVIVQESDETIDLDTDVYVGNPPEATED